MNLSQPAKKKYYDRIDIAQLAVSILVVFLSLISIGVAGLAAFGQVAMDDGSTVVMEPAMVIGLGLTGLVFLVIAFVSTVTTIRKITGQATFLKRVNEKAMFWTIGGLFLVFILAALMGILTPERKAVLLAILAIPGIGLPVLFLLQFGSRSQRAVNPKRDFGILTFTIGISTPYIVLVEMLVAIILLIIAAAGFLSNPEFMKLFTTLQNNPELLQNDPASLFTDFASILDFTNLMGWLLLVVSGIMPLIEELFKTIAVWLLKVRNPGPAATFRVGLLSGGGFALFEGLFSVISLPLSEVGYAEWAGLILGRFGGSLLHILTGGIIGLAIGVYWQNRQLLPLLLSYLGAWLLHAAWNALAIYGGINPLLQESQAQAIWPYIGLVLLFVGMLFAYLRLISKARTVNENFLYPTGVEA